MPLFLLRGDMASKLLRIEERGERRIAVYESGLERDADTGRIVKPAPGTVIRTAAKSTELHRRRQEKTAALIRRGIAEASAAVLPSPVTSAPEAVAAAAAMLWEEIVLNSDAYPRDRVQAFESIGKYAQALPTGKDAAADDAAARQAVANATAAAANVAAAAVLARVLGDVARMQAANPDRVVIDVPTSDQRPAAAADADQPHALPPPHAAAAEQPNRTEPNE